MEVDLHMHTIYSDGTKTPEEVLEIAKGKGLKAIAITDHDTVDGLLYLKSKDLTSENLANIELINGIEFSCNENGKDVHVLGYFLNLEDEVFLKKLRELEKIREERNFKILEKLKTRGIDLDYNRLKEIAGGNIVGRLHIAKYLIELKAVKTIAEAFTKYLGKDGWAYVEKENFPPDLAVKLIKENGAFSSLAHPKLITKDDYYLNNLINRLAKLGLNAIEANYPNFSKSEVRKYRRLAKNYGLLFTGGSDYHGDNRKNIEIGSCGLTYDYFTTIKDYMKNK